MRGTRGSEAGTGGAPRRALGMLAVGAAAGLALAAAGLLSAGGGRGGAPPQGAVATVNGVPIRAEDFERLVAGLESERRTPLADADRRRLLERLIEEELLVQRGLDLGLARTERRVRAGLVAAVVASATAEAGTREPEPEELRAFYEDHRDVFAQPGRLRVRQIFVDDSNGEPEEARRAREASGSERLRAPEENGEPDAAARARDARRRLAAGDSFAEVRQALGDPEPAPLPDALLPPAKLREYLGATAARVAGALEVGEVSEPVRTGAGWRVLELVAREPERLPPFAEIEPVVRAEWRRRAGDRALREYLDTLRGRADVSVAPELQRATQ